MGASEAVFPASRLAMLSVWARNLGTISSFAHLYPESGDGVVVRYLAVQRERRWDGVPPPHCPTRCVTEPDAVRVSLEQRRVVREPEVDGRHGTHQTEDDERDADGRDERVGVVMRMIPNSRAGQLVIDRPRPW